MSICMCMYVYIAVSIGILVLQQFDYHKWTTASHTQRRYIVRFLLLLLQFFVFFLCVAEINRKLTP